VSADEQVAEDTPDREDGDHLTGVPDGAGCTEIWEHLAERREKHDDD
jgi:hypothetical protein